MSNVDWLTKRVLSVQQNGALKAHVAVAAPLECIGRPKDRP